MASSSSSSSTLYEYPKNPFDLVRTPFYKRRGGHTPRNPKPCAECQETHGGGSPQLSPIDFAKTSTVRLTALNLNLDPT